MSWRGQGGRVWWWWWWWWRGGGARCPKPFSPRLLAADLSVCTASWGSWLPPDILSCLSACFSGLASKCVPQDGFGCWSVLRMHFLERCRTYRRRFNVKCQIPDRWFHAIVSVVLTATHSYALKFLRALNNCYVGGKLCFGLNNNDDRSSKKQKQPKLSAHFIPILCWNN